MRNIRLLKLFKFLQVLLLISTTAVASQKREREEPGEEPRMTSAKTEQYPGQFFGDDYFGPVFEEEAEMEVDSEEEGIFPSRERQIGYATQEFLAERNYTAQDRAIWEAELNKFALFHDDECGTFTPIGSFADVRNRAFDLSWCRGPQYLQINGVSVNPFTKIVITRNIEEFFWIEEEEKLMMLVALRPEVEDAIRMANPAEPHPFSVIVQGTPHNHEIFMLREWRQPTSSPFGFFFRSSTQTDLTKFAYNLQTTPRSIEEEIFFPHLKNIYSTIDVTDHSEEREAVGLDEYLATALEHICISRGGLQALLDIEAFLMSDAFRFRQK